MCGRINVSDSEGVQALMAMLGMPLYPSAPPRWNVSPTSLLNAVVSDTQQDAAPLNTTMLRWGISAPWSEPGKSTRPLINARSETLFSKPTFRDIAKQYRTVVPVNGFYEWERVGDDRIPYYVQVQNLPAMLLAAVYQPVTAEDIAKEQHTAEATPQLGFSFEEELPGSDEGPDELENTTPPFTGDFAVVTTEATGTMANIHHRAPVMLNIEQAKRWLYTDDPAEVEAMAAPDAIMDVTLRRVSRAVNSTRNDSEACVADAEDD